MVCCDSTEKERRVDDQDNAAEAEKDEGQVGRIQMFLHMLGETLYLIFSRKNTKMGPVLYSVDTVLIGSLFKQ